MSREFVGSVPPRPETDLDVVAVPAIGADPVRAWWDENSETPWPVAELATHLPRARVLLADHGKLKPHNTLEDLANKLLTQLHDKRQSTISKRPIVFICHSTGGLVAKAALIIASQSPSNLQSIYSSCYGIAFLATPHQGSSYLSAPEYVKSVHHLLQLKYRVPPRLREFFRPRHPHLLHLSSHFRSICADMKLWTFLETAESILPITDSVTKSTVEMHVPITSIRSGVLNFEHEKEIPLATDHIGTACFKGQERTTRMGFIKELQFFTKAALRLSAMRDNPLHVKREIKVQVNGFFEDPARGVSDETPLKLWSTKSSLHDYIKNGPSTCLGERLKQTGGVPTTPLDDSSVSSFDSRPSSPYGPSMIDEMHGGGVSKEPEPAPVRPSMKQSRSFVVPTSPRIHVTEPTAENYFDEDSEQRDPEELDPGRSEEEPAQDAQKVEPARPSSGSSGTGSFELTHRTSLSAKYKKFLPIPTSMRERLNEMTAETPRVAPRFDRPEPGTEKLLWIHVPYTHTGWVPPVLGKACEEDQQSEFFRKVLNDRNWWANLYNRHVDPHSRFVRPACIHFRQTNPSPMDTPGVPDDPRLALYLPYLHWDTYWNLVQRRNIIEERVQQGRSKPVPDHVAQSDLESKLIWKYLGSDPPIHIRRTLDQFGYPNLRSTEARDDDQMLWKRTRKPIDLNEELGEPPPPQYRTQSPRNFTDGKVLMVDQLWLWVVDQKTVVTFFPKQEPTKAEDKLYEQTNLHNSIYNELNGDLARRFETAGDLAALIALHAVTVLLDRTLYHDLQVLRIFEESIGILTESVTKSFKRFRNRGFNTHPAEYNKNADGKMMTAKERSQRDELIARQNREDLSALLELRDIMDELGTIAKLLDQQHATLDTMSEYFEDKGYGRVFVDQALARIDDYRNQSLEMRENALLAQKSVENLLDLKQKQANVDESRMARWQAEVTQSQSQAVMVFTIFTVIFLPLSFFTSLFGMNASEWSGEATNLSLATMFEIAAPTSFAIIVAALIMAFSERLRAAVSEAHKITFTVAKDVFLASFAAFTRLIIFTNNHKPNHHNDNDDVSYDKTVPVNGETSSVKSKLSRYRYFRRGHRQIRDDDIWGRHVDRGMSALPPAEVEAGYVSEKGGGFSRRGTNFT